MKTMKKIVCALMTLVLLLSSVPTVFADEADTKTIDQDAACSLTIWKFDYTNAKKDGVWDEDAFPSTGWQESYVENALVNTNRKGDTDGQNGNALGNGQTSKGYAIAGVEFTYLKAADIVTFENQGTTQVLYGFHKTDAADLLKSIGLESGANRCAEADSLDADRYFYTSDTLNKALAQSLEANSTTVKNALEAFIRNGYGSHQRSRQDLCQGSERRSVSAGRNQGPRNGHFHDQPILRLPAHDHRHRQ